MWAWISAAFAYLQHSGYLEPILAALIAWLCPSPATMKMKADLKFRDEESKILDAILNAKTNEERVSLAKILDDHRASRAAK